MPKLYAYYFVCLIPTALLIPLAIGDSSVKVGSIIGISALSLGILFSPTPKASPKHKGGVVLAQVLAAVPFLASWVAFGIWKLLKSN